tara:strand:+ start:144 stop:296 length:153 start_codon:yes stop_codon:yes gene_type:complete
VVVEGAQEVEELLQLFHLLEMVYQEDQEEVVVELVVQLQIQLVELVTLLQ